MTTYIFADLCELVSASNCFASKKKTSKLKVSNRTSECVCSVHFQFFLNVLFAPILFFFSGNRVAYISQQNKHFKNAEFRLTTHTQSKIINFIACMLHPVTVIKLSLLLYVSRVHLAILDPRALPYRRNREELWGRERHLARIEGLVHMRIQWKPVHSKSQGKEKIVRIGGGSK